MEKYLNKGIKEIIAKFPKVVGILDEYHIGCAPCGVGSCLLKDIVEIHNLPSAEEAELMYKIEKEIYPDRDIKMPVVNKNRKEPKDIKYSPPMKKLVDEHVLIKRFIALIPRLIENIDFETILKGVDFIRSYADKFHHAKEEEILFKYFDENLDILKTIHEDHETGRAHVRAIVAAVEKKDRYAIAEHLNGYKELLTEHIKKEDEILYPWMDRNLSVRQIGEIFSKFNDTDNTFGDAPKRYEEFVVGLEERFGVYPERSRREVAR